MTKVELNQKTINFLYILAQQNITLIDMFQEQGWIGEEYSRWDKEEVIGILRDLFNSVRDHNTERTPVSKPFFYITCI